MREARVYSEIVPHTMPVAEMLARKPKAIILSGGPSCVYAEGAPGIDDHVFTAGVPVFGMCYGFQLMAQGLGGEVAHTGAREYGRTPVSVSEPGTLLAGLPPSTRSGCRTATPSPRRPRASPCSPRPRTPRSPRSRTSTAGSPASSGTPRCCTPSTASRCSSTSSTTSPAAARRGPCSTSWRSRSSAIREQIGDSGLAICGLSGGVDSAVAAAIVQRAIGDRLHCVFVDHGLLREGEAEQVERDFVAATGVNLHVFDARETFLAALAGVTDPEEKRKIIGREFIRAFEAAEVQVLGEAAEHGDKVGFLVQGTLYPDVVESGGGAGTSNIKSHHNVGGLPEDLEFALVEPLRTLFKDEVRLVGEQLGLPPRWCGASPSPAPASASASSARSRRDRLDILRRADAIAREELTRAGLDRDIWQMPVVLLADVRSVGVQGDGRTYGHPVVIRPVTSEDAMTADWARLPYDVMERISTRITNEVAEVNRVTLDITSQAPGHHRVGVSQPDSSRHVWVDTSRGQPRRSEPMTSRGMESVASTARARAYAASRAAAAHERVERQRQPGDDAGGEEQEPGQVRVGGAAEAAARAAGDTADGEAGEERGPTASTMPRTTSAAARGAETGRGSIAPPCQRSRVATCRARCTTWTSGSPSSPPRRGSGRGCSPVRLSARRGRCRGCTRTAPTSSWSTRPTSTASTTGCGRG